MLAFNGLNSGSRVRYVGKNPSIHGFLESKAAPRVEVSNRVASGKLAITVTHPASDEQEAFLVEPESLQAL